MLPLHSSGSSMGSFLSLPSSTLKRSRAASAPCESDEARQRKRSRSSPGNDLTNEKIQEEEDREDSGVDSSKGKGKEKESTLPAGHSLVAGVTAAVVEELAQELKCGCCTELCYNPVVVFPCQHFFCGSCCILWIRNGGTNCPACRSISNSVTPARIVHSMIDILLRADPSKGRTNNERMQADQVYRAGTALRLPTPRPITPEPNLEPANDNFARPCPTCLPGNAYGWRCPVPISDPAVDQENAFDLDDGTPPGHTFCGNCDQLHNLQAPTTTKCDFCQVSFCGVGIQGRCCALGLLAQQPQGMSDLQDVILSGSIYHCFQSNSVEIDILVDYLRTNDISLRGVYKEIVTYTLQQPNTFAPLIESGVFDDLHPVAGSDDPDPTTARRRICRPCAAQVLLHGFKDWWIRERKQGNLPDDILARKDCPQGSGCDKQTDPTHSKKFNHIIQSLVPAPAPGPPAAEASFLIIPPLPPPPAVMPINQQSAPAAEPSDIEMLPPLPRDEDEGMLPPPPPEAASTSQTEVEALTGNMPIAGSSSITQRAFVYVPDAPQSSHGDVVMTDVEGGDSKDDGGARSDAGERMEPEQGPVPKLSRAHVFPLSPNA